VKWIVTGAAGFIGCNAVAALAKRGDEVIGIDNLSRPGTESNLEWLREQVGDPFTFVRCDVRETEALDEAFAAHSDAGAIVHLAGQVAVTTSIRDPRADFEINALGTFNVCDAVRRHVPSAVLINASTNKVYGEGSEHLELRDGRWWSVDQPEGIDESMPLDFHSPYACSKGAGDQYVLDYARTYGLAAVSLRQSCIYGPRQFGIEDQGWVAWLSAAALAGRPFTIYGDGRQVRDILFVDDLVALYVACAAAPDKIAGRALNAGGGPANALSLLDLVAFLERRLGRPVEYDRAEPRLGDQRFFVADSGRAHALLGWSPQIDAPTGLARLTDWLEENLDAVLAAVDARRLAESPAGG
jgi:CDP-paratose 2-epimerase